VALPVAQFGLDAIWGPLLRFVHVKPLDRRPLGHYICSQCGGRRGRLASCLTPVRACLVLMPGLVVSVIRQWLPFVYQDPIPDQGHGWNVML